MVNQFRFSWYSLLLITFLVLMYNQVINKAEYSRLDWMITNILLFGIVGLNLYSLGINLRAIYDRKERFLQRALFLLGILLILGTHSTYLFDDSMKIYGFYHQIISVLKDMY